MREISTVRISLLARARLTGQAGRMDQVLRTREAIARFGRSKVRHAIAAGRWQQPCRGIVVLHDGQLTPLQTDLVALASAPCRTVLGGLSALAYDGFEGFEPRSRFLVLPSGAKPPRLLDTVLHWSTEISDLDVHPLREPRRTRPARSLIDAASWSRNRRYARAIVIAGIQQGLTTPRGIREALTRRGPCRHRALIVQSVLDAAGGIQSLPERDFNEIRHSAGLPEPTRQRPLKGPKGSYYLDVYIAELGLAIEIHGIPHMAVQKWDADLLRANEIVIAGEQLLIFSSYAIRHQKSAVIDQLRRIARN